MSARATKEISRSTLYIVHYYESEAVRLKRAIEGSESFGMLRDPMSMLVWV